MKYISVSTKLNIAIVSISLASILIGSFVLFSYAKEIENDVYESTRIELINEANDKIESKMRVGITNAISIANDDRISTALKENAREGAIESLSDISSKMKKYTKFKNIKVHIHTKENKSFLRNWKLDKYGDDLSSFRASVVRVNDTSRPVITFEAGRAGLLLRAISPIVDKKGNHMGSLEFIQGINSVVKTLDKANQGFLLLMEQDLKDKIQTGKNFSFNDDVIFQDYIISQKYINQDFLNDARSINMQELFENRYLLSSKYFYTYLKIEDFQNKNLGIVLLSKPLEKVNSAIDGAKILIYIALGGMLTMAITISLVILTAVRKLVIRPLGKFENALLDFFLFLQGKKDFTNTLDINTNDEFGTMARSLEENISYTVKIHEEINSLNTHLEEMVDEKTKKVTALLNNAGQGFLSFSCNMIIDKEYSNECIKLLGDDLGGKQIPEVLFQNSDKKKFFQKTILEACQIDNSLVQETMLSLLPKEIILHKRALLLEYKILESKKLMMIITNITSQKKLQKKIKREQDFLKMIVEIISESDSFYDTKKEYERFIDSFKNNIEVSKTPLHNINNLYRIIHTFKGAFSQMYMNDTVKFLHSLENELSSMLKDSIHTNENLLELLEKVNFKENFQKELAIIRKILGDEFLDSDSFLKINCSDISKLQIKISNVFEEQKFENIESKEIINQLTSLSSQKLMHSVKQYPSLVLQLAQRLEKEVYPFEIIGDDEIVISEVYKPFMKSLIHIFRNSIDHGIEDPETRLENNKDEIGTISCSFMTDNDRIRIIISDDGAGIDKDKVLSKAINQKVITQGEALVLNESEIYSLIFEENFSTKEDISDISGRGVGLNAVKVEIDKIGGYIEVTSSKNIGTTFTLNLPRQGELL